LLSEEQRALSEWQNRGCDLNLWHFVGGDMLVVVAVVVVVVLPV
jgi:hypothetical protein